MVGELLGGEHSCGALSRRGERPDSPESAEGEPHEKRTPFWWRLLLGPLRRRLGRDSGAPRITPGISRGHPATACGADPGQSPTRTRFLLPLCCCSSLMVSILSSQAQCAEAAAPARRVGGQLVAAAVSRRPSLNSPEVRRLAVLSSC